METIRRRRKKGLFLREKGSREASLTLLYFHGLGESGLGFEALVHHPRLDPFYQVVPDFPGYGHSDWAEEPLDFAAQADLAAELVTEMRVAPVVVLGHSMGGVTGLMFCERYPELVRGFFNVEGNITGEDSIFSARVASQPLEMFLAEGFRRLLDDVYERGVRERALRDYFASARHCDPRQYYHNSCELAEISGGGTLASRLARLAVPVLYILADPRGRSTETRRQLADAGIPREIVTNSGHWPFADQPERFVDLLTAFLQRIPSSGSGQ